MADNNMDAGRASRGPGAAGVSPQATGLIEEEEKHSSDIPTVTAQELHWRMQVMGWRASSLHSVRQCSRFPLDGGYVRVNVTRNPDGSERRYLSGLRRCGSKQCPRCSTMIAVRRASQLAGGLEWWLNDQHGEHCDERHQCLHPLRCAYFMTLTMRHQASDAADMLMAALTKARSALTQGASYRGGPRYMGDRERFGIAGIVSAVEATWSRRRGYHFHLHLLVLTIEPLTVASFVDMGLRFHGRWWASMNARGYDSTLKGFDLRPVDDAAEIMASYVSKGSSLDAAQELTSGSLKHGRQTSYGFFDLLAEICAHPQASQFWFPLPRGCSVVWQDESTMNVVNEHSGEVIATYHMRGVMRLWRPVHELEGTLKHRRTHTYSNRKANPNTLLDRLWNAFLDHVKPDTRTDEQLAENTAAVGVTERWIDSTEWGKCYLEHPERILGLLRGASTA